MAVLDALLNLFVYLVIGAGLASCVFIAGWIWFHFPSRTVDDVIGYLRPVDLDAARALINPVSEACSRQSLSRGEFRGQQRKNIYLYSEIVHRMSHNAGILVDWMNTQDGCTQDEIQPLSREVQQESAQVRIYALLTLIKLRFWLAIRLHAWAILPAPCLAETNEAGGIEGLESYDRLKTAASRLFLELRSERVDELVQNL